MSSDRPFETPPDRHYDREHHLWAHRDVESGRVRIGIDSIGLSSLGDLAYVSLHATGTTTPRGSALGSLEAAKMTTTIAAPVTGTIVARNDAVLKDPSLVNADPYGAGWLVEIEPARWEQDSAELVSGGAIEPWLAAEVERLQTEGRTD